MSIEVPVSWLSYCDSNPARVRWDQRSVGRLLAGEEGHPPGGYTFVDTPWTPEDGRGRVIVMPVGHYHDHGEEHRVRHYLMDDLAKLWWAIVIATSDECSHFQWHKIDPWPEHVRLWVMTPRVDRAYPPGTRFIGEGSPTPAREILHGAALTRDLDMFYSGQPGTERRQQARAAMVKAVNSGNLRAKVNTTKAFLTDSNGKQVDRPGGDHEYLFGLTRAWIAPAPTGTCTQDSFRFYEALEAGCIPVADALSPHGNAGYWAMLGMDKIAPIIEYWRDLPSMAESLLVDRCATAAHISSRWQRYKRRLVHQLHDDIELMSGQRHGDGPADKITVIVATSPVPSNPDIAMIQSVIESVRINLPGAEILIACDGVRDELPQHRRDDYHHFLHRLCCWALTQHNVCVFTHHEHLHESGLLHSVMPEVRTDYVMFVEHDCPLIQPVDFAACLEEMNRYELRHLRFGHERHVLAEHGYLYLEMEPEPGTRHIRTVQYSSRPALYTTELMNGLLDVYFDVDARAMIESCLYGPWQWAPDAPPGADPAFAARLHLVEAWKRYRSALWAPGPNLAFSGHLDGRGSDANAPITIKYRDGVVPDGAPQEGTVEI